MVPRRALAQNLAATLLAGDWTRPAIDAAVAGLFGGVRPETRARLVSELIDSAATSYPPAPAWLVSHFLASRPFGRLYRGLSAAAQFPAIALGPARFAPAQVFAGLALPRIATPKDLADRLRLPLEQLDWLADTKRLQGRTAIPVLQHYTYRFAAKRHGSARLLEAPKPKLRSIQRQILHEILDLVPPHENAHGFVKGRSCLGGAQVHAGEFIVIAMDLRSFFATVPAARVHGIFRSLGYPHAVARLLTGLCTTATPPSVFPQRRASSSADIQTRGFHALRHLPQGAPTSPALANLSAWHLDQRLSRLARRFDARYTRYADDLAFSGDETLAATARRFLRFVQVIIEDEGFTVHPRKTRIMRRDARQRITGLVVNVHLNVPRPAYDELKAILHNCRRSGPREQNRDGVPDFRAHLDGRVAWVEAVNPARGEKLRRIFDTIAW